MMVPIALGLAPFGTLSLAEEVLQAYLRLQGQGGYASDADSARVRELMAWAIEQGLGVGGLDSAYDSIWGSVGLEMLPDHEEWRRIPNDAARSILERQRRLRAWASMKRTLNASSVALLSEILEMDFGIVKAPVAGRVRQLAAAASTLAMALTLDAADWASLEKRTAESLARRMAPAGAFGHHNFRAASEMVVQSSATPAKWGSTTSILGQHALHPTAGLDALPTPTPRAGCRVRDFAGIERVTARDMNAIQDAILFGKADQTTSLDYAPGGSVTRAFAVSIAAGATAQVVAGDMRNRIGRSWIRYNTVDIRPGQASDIVCDASSMHASTWYTGTGAAGYNHAIPVSGGSVCRGTATGWEIINNDAVTRYFVGVVELGPAQLSVDGPHPGRITSMDEGQAFDVANYDAALWASLRGEAMRAANGAAVDAWVGYPTSVYGGVARFGVVAFSERPASGAITWWVDGSVDWRDRIIVVQPLYRDGAGEAIFPGTPGDDALDGVAGIGVNPATVGYTGTGVPILQASPQNYHIQVETIFRVAADDQSGWLVIEHSELSTVASGCFAVLVTATEQLQKRSAASAPVDAAAPGDGDEMLAQPLNWVQDVQVLGQMRGLPGGTLEAGRPSDAMPLGPIVRGSPKLPVSWIVKRRDGSRHNVVGYDNGQRAFPPDLAEEVRQPVAGRLRRHFALTIANNTTRQLDTQYDWRDRAIFASLCLSNLDLTPGQVNDTGLSNAGNAYHGGAYLGPGTTGTDYALEFVGAGQLYMRANPTTGSLEIHSAMGLTVTIVGTVDATFPLGPRHPVHS